MPELPEVETLRTGLEKLVVDKKIKDVKVLSSKIAAPSAVFLEKTLKDKKFKKIERRGKLLIFYIKKNLYLLIHLKMTGQLIYVSKSESLLGGHSLVKKDEEINFSNSSGGELPNKYTRAIISFIDGSNLYFNDLRKFGYLKIVDENELNKLLLNNYGPEPDSNEFNYNYLKNNLSNKSVSIKAYLLNQKNIAGLGNIYVDEALHLSGIRPDRIASNLKDVEIEKLVKEIKKIIKKAIKYNGTTFSDFRDVKGKKGNFSKFLKVYGRGGKSCYFCSSEIKKIKLAGRGTHYCPSCQK
ncbi:MAG: bifunctional DNA-formamidopyrimidine glycosylase/DNA-(apurinic or apyrimidinic site) lyase [Patescibacteria group bacterium]|jgi:formamidopyrimidine-DNA glycosylase|nr:bifunctional DNA-formamidopyrimidine glycosylase/DNA-(apurinic or apyrimidinic site) lyase [Patescibacteria group bacterium]